MGNRKIVSILSRAAVSFSLLYAAISSFINPDAWIGYFPMFLQNIFPVTVLLTIFSIIEIILALSIIFMRSPFYPSLISAALLFGIVVFNLGAIDIVFRDVSIFLAALALAVLHAHDRKDHVDNYH